MSKFGGSTLTPDDEPRLDTQLYYVYHIMKDGVWRTIPQLVALMLSRYGVTMQTSVSARIRDFRKAKFGGHTVNAYNMGGGLWNYQLIVRSKQVTFNLGERIKQIRAIEAKIEKETTEFDLRMKPYEDFATAARAEVLQFLLKSRQKSTNTEFGGAYWKPKITYSVEDKVAFQRHIIGTEQWDLTTWAATPSISEAFTQEHEGVPPPGLKRSEVINVYITPPVKPRVKKAPAAPATAEPQVESLT